jgi:molybdenum cofactor cytidylyltransferase
MSERPALSALVLAGGEGRRFDPSGRRWKLAERLVDGRPVLRATCESLLGRADELVVVCGGHHALVVALLEGLPARIVPCPQAAAGMGATIKCGIRATQPSLGWLLALGDMPFVAPGTLAALAQALRAGAPIVRPVFDGRPGHPVGFAASLRERLLAIDDAAGAAALLRDLGKAVRRLPCADPGCVRDVDLPGDLAGGPAGEPPPGPPAR